MIQTDTTALPVLQDSACFETAGGTSLTGSITAAAGETVVAVVTTRSTTSYPAGWTVLCQSPVVDPTYTQRVAVLYCRSTGGTVSCAVTQSKSARIYLTLLCFAGVSSLVRHSEAEYASSAAETSFTVQRPEGGMMLWCLCSTIWYTSIPSQTWTCNGSSDGIISLDPAGTQPRQGCLADTGQPGSRLFAGYTSQSYYLCECVELVGVTTRHRYLTASGGLLYTLRDGALEPLEQGTGLSAQVFSEQGSLLPPGPELLASLPSPTLYHWTDGTAIDDMQAAVTATPLDQPIVAVCDMSHESILGITALSALGSETVGVSLSLDGGVTFQEEQTLPDFLARDPAALWQALPESRRLVLRAMLHGGDTLTQLQFTFANPEE